MTPHARKSAARLLVGVDAGASHTEAVVADETLRERGRARGPSGAVGPERAGGAARAIIATVQEALRKAGAGAQRPDALVVGAAGVGRETERDALLRALREAGLARAIAVTTDGAVALESAFPAGPGILLSAGSGSIGYARDRSGGVWRVGGLGWQLGDEGSGYSLGRAGLAAVGRAADGRGPETALAAAITLHVGVDALDGLVRWANGAAPGAVASLARIVQATARDGDPVAQGLVRQAARDLADHVAALLPRLVGEPHVTVALAGGILSEGWPVREALLQVLAERMPHVTLSTLPVDPPRGALSLAARLSRDG